MSAVDSVFESTFWVDMIFWARRVRGNDALGFYEREGFAPTGELSGGDVIVMRRKR